MILKQWSININEQFNGIKIYKSNTSHSANSINVNYWYTNYTAYANWFVQRK